jgi:hypothetical protein
LTDPVVGSGSERQKVGEKQVVDVVLQRAVDVLKGIRMLSSWR